MTVWLFLFLKVDSVLSGPVPLGTLDPNASHIEAMRNAQDLSILKNDSYKGVSIKQEVNFKTGVGFKEAELPSIDTQQPSPQIITSTLNDSAQLNLNSQTKLTNLNLQQIATQPISNSVIIGGVGAVINGDVYVVLEVNGDTNLSSGR